MQNKFIFIFTIVFGLCVFIGLYNLLSSKYEGLENQPPTELQNTLRELEGLVLQYLQKIEPQLEQQLPQIESNVEKMLQFALQQLHEIQEKPIGEQQIMLKKFGKQIEAQLPLFEKEVENQMKSLTPEQQKVSVDGLNKVKDKLKQLLIPTASSLTPVSNSTTTVYNY